MEFIGQITPGFLIVAMSWVAGGAVGVVRKSADPMIIPLIVTIGWGLSHL